MKYTYASSKEDLNRPVQQADSPNKTGSGLRDSGLPEVNLSGVPISNDCKLSDTKPLTYDPDAEDETPAWGESTPQLLDLSEQLLDWVEEEYGNRYSVADYPAVAQVVVEVFPNPEAIWDFCMAYALTAMDKRQDPSETITIAAGEIGVYYLAALTLFYSIEEASAGRIPPIQMMSEELVDLLYACAPTNRMNRAWVVNWDDFDLLSLINSLPYHSYQNPSLTIAPLLETEDATGRRLLETTNFNVTFNDLREIGPQAFEIIQRYLLGTVRSQRLYAYTEDGDTTNIAMFAFSRDPNAVNPVDGFRQVVLEAPLKQRDLAYYSLNFFGDKVGRRDGWSPRTAQISTVPMMNLITNGYASVSMNVKYQTHMVNFQTVLYNFLLEAVSAVVNTRDERTLAEIQALGTLEDGYMDTATAGQILTAVLQWTSRRFAVYSAWAAGTVLPEENCKVIGAGSRFMTFQYVDNFHTFLPLIEQVAGASLFYDDLQDMLCVPVLTSRGDLQTLDYDTLGGNSLTSILKQLYPQLESVTYNLLTANQIPDVIDVGSSGSYCLTAGTSPKRAGQTVNSIVATLQPYCAIGNAVGNRDGAFHKGLYLTHYVSDDVDGMGFDITSLQQVIAVLATLPVSSKNIATSLSCFAPVMYGPRNGGLIGAYQILYSRNNTIRVEEDYMTYRAAREVADGHRRASNINAPDEYGIHIARRTYVGKGGAFFSLLTKGGKVIDTGSRFFGHILDIVAPKAAKKVNHYIERGRKGMREMFAKHPEYAVHFNPVEHGLIDPERLFAAVDHLENTKGLHFDKHIGPVLNSRSRIKLPHTNANPPKRQKSVNNSKRRKVARNQRVKKRR